MDGTGGTDGTLQGRVAMITGASGALGRAVVAAARQAGARTILVDRRSTISPVDDELVLEGDLTSETEVARVVEEGLSRMGRLDVLFNVAGGFEMGPAFHEMPLESWDRMLDMNARTAFLTCRAVIPHMLKNEGGGKIVNVAARAALEGKAKMAPYVVSKAAVVRLTESLAAEYRASGINVNCVLPGTIDTPRNREDMPKAHFDRWVPPEALADAILFLASDQARAIHGAALPVFGLS